MSCLPVGERKELTYEVALYELAHLFEIFLSKVVVVVKGNAVEGKFVS